MPEKSIGDVLDKYYKGQHLFYPEIRYTKEEAITDIKEVLRKEIIECFVKEVERRAELKILLTHKLEGAHYAAMKELLAEEKWIDTAISEIKEILRGRVTEILDTAMIKEYGMFRVGFVEEIVDKIMGEIK